MGKVKSLLMELEEQGIIQWSDVHATYMIEEAGELVPFDLTDYLYKRNRQRAKEAKEA